MRDVIRRWREPRPHPLTGDLLSPGEYVTWQVMGIYRRWTVFCLLQALTLTWWTQPQWFPGGLAGWNYLWSDLAVMVEMLVGIAFLGQAMRDAQVLRKELREITAVHAELTRLVAEVHAAVTSD
jgi:hypothetical protein